MVIIPAVFDLIGTALAKVGLMYTSVSVYQLIRSSVIIFCAIFNIFLLKKKIRGQCDCPCLSLVPHVFIGCSAAFMWLGIFAITVSMVHATLRSGQD